MKLAKNTVINVPSACKRKMDCTNHKSKDKYWATKNKFINIAEPIPAKESSNRKYRLIK